MGARRHETCSLQTHIRRHLNNTPKQYHILVTGGWMKTLAIRSDFDYRF